MEKKIIYPKANKRKPVDRQTSEILAAEQASGWLVDPEGNSKSRDSIVYYTKKLANQIRQIFQNDTTVVATDILHHPVGMATFEEIGRTNDGNPILFLKADVVLPEYQGKGIYSKLFRLRMQKIFEQYAGIEVVIISESRNPIVERIFKNNGFKIKPMDMMYRELEAHGLPPEDHTSPAEIFQARIQGEHGFEKHVAIPEKIVTNSNLR